MRHEIGEGLSFSCGLKLYLMKGASLYDADLQQHQGADDFYTERRIALTRKLDFKYRQNCSTP